jgi:hypothetical protein
MPHGQEALLDGAGLRTPFEGLSRGFRKSQKLVDRGLGGVVESVERLATVAGSLTPTEALDAIKGLRSQLLELRSQVSVDVDMGDTGGAGEGGACATGGGGAP